MTTDSRFTLLKTDLLGAGCAAIILAATVILAIGPSIQAKREQDDLDLQQASLSAEFSAASERLLGTRRRIARAKQQAQQIPEELLDDRDLNVRIARLVEQSGTLGIEIQSILPGEPRVQERLTRIPIGLKTRAPIGSVSRFLHEIHTSSQDLDLTRLQIDGVNDGDRLNVQIDTEWITITQ